VTSFSSEAHVFLRNTSIACRVCISLIWPVSSMTDKNFPLIISALMQNLRKHIDCEADVESAEESSTALLRTVQQLTLKKIF
jgi:hypothetical protein